MADMQIAVIVGSLRKESLNRHLADAIVKMAPSNVTFQFVEIGNLPLYNQDDDERQAESVRKLKAEIYQSDAVLFVAP